MSSGIRKLAGSALLLLEQGLNAVRMRLWSLRLKSLGRGSLIYPRAVIYSPRGVSIGSNVSINDFVHIRGGGEVVIGDDTLIAPGTVITSQTHAVDALASGQLYRETNLSGAVRIGKNVWIGAGAIVLPGVTIGDGCIVAAGALVRSDMAPATLVAGIPARVLKQLAP